MLNIDIADVTQRAFLTYHFTFLFDFSLLFLFLFSFFPQIAERIDENHIREQVSLESFAFLLPMTNT